MSCSLNQLLELSQAHINLVYAGVGGCAAFAMVLLGLDRVAVCSLLLLAQHGRCHG